MPALHALLRQMMQRDATRAVLQSENPVQMFARDQIFGGSALSSARIEQMVREIAPVALDSQAPFDFQIHFEGATFVLRGQFAQIFANRGAQLEIERILAPPVDFSKPPPPVSQNSQWIYFVNGQQSSPLDGAQITQMVRAGTLPPTILVWQNGLANWIPAPDSVLWPQELPRPTPQIHSTSSAMIPTDNPQALWSYYIGIFAIVPVLGVVMGPTALIMGIKGLNVFRENPAVRGKTHAWIGIGCGILWTVVHWISAFLVLASLFFRRGF